MFGYSFRQKKARLRFRNTTYFLIVWGESGDRRSQLSRHNSETGQEQELELGKAPAERKQRRYLNVVIACCKVCPFLHQYWLCIPLSG